MINHIKRIVADILENFTTTKYGEITAYNPINYTVKVELQPEGVETGFVPLEAAWVGNGFGAVFGPNIGDQARLSFIDGRVQATVVGGRFFNNANQPPVVQSGQAAFVDSKGSYIRLNNDGTITMGSSAGIIAATPIFKVVGQILATGNITTNADVITSTLSSVNAHVHGGVQSGSSNTAGPQG